MDLSYDYIHLQTGLQTTAALKEHRKDRLLVLKNGQVSEEEPNKQTARLNLLYRLRFSIRKRIFSSVIRKQTKTRFPRQVQIIHLCYCTDMSKHDSCEVFSNQLQNVEALIIHCFRLTGFAAIRQTDPMEAAKLWKQMSELCNQLLLALKETKEIYPHYGIPQLYDLALDYQLAAYRRYSENLQDSEI